MTADGNWIAARLDNQERVPLAHNWRRIDFAGGSAMAIAIPWGDLATAWFSTGIPNIETYVAVPRAAAIASRMLNWLRPLLALGPWTGDTTAARQWHQRTL